MSDKTLAILTENQAEALGEEKRKNSAEKYKMDRKSNRVIKRECTPKKIKTHTPNAGKEEKIKSTKWLFITLFSLTTFFHEIYTTLQILFLKYI